MENNNTEILSVTYKKNLTLIDNILDLAARLHIPSIIIMKYWGAKLKASTHGNKLCIGYPTRKFLLSLLKEFIFKYLTCARCNSNATFFNNPSKDDKEIHRKCTGCGFDQVLIKREFSFVPVIARFYNYDLSTLEIL